MSADTIIVNAAVQTMDDDRPRAEAIALEDGLVLKVGTRDEIEALAHGGTDVIDADGGSVLPGFIESHAHLFLGGAELMNLHLDNCADPVMLREMIREFAARHSDRAMIVAQSPDYGVFENGSPRLFLDEVLPDRPLALVAHDHHTVWANTRALDGAGVLHGRRTSPGHEVVMGEDGLATGTLLEPEAFGPVMRLSGQERSTLGLRNGREPDPAPTDAEREDDLDHIRRGLAHAVKHGITSIVNMDGNFYTLELLEEMRARGELTARVRVPFHFLPEMETADLDRARAMTERWNDDWLASGFVKIFMDGVIDSRTAFMKHDYPGQPGYRSHGRFDAGRFADLARRINAMGLQIAVHAIGDAAIERTIDGYAASRGSNGAHDLRNRIEHLELVDPDDFARMGDLDITASIQPPHAPGTAGLPLEPTLSNIGRKRWPDAFAWQRLAESGAPIALGSDWPVASIDPLVGIHAAVTRRAWCDDVPDHRFPLEAALKGYTCGGAYAERSEKLKGSLTPGKAADLVILDGPIDAVTEGIDKGARVKRTICGGRTVYHATSRPN